MPTNTPNFSIPYPIGSDPAYISSDMQAMAEQTDSELKGYIDTAVGQGLAGNIVHVTTTDYTASNRDFLLCDQVNPVTITFTTPATEGDFIRVVNFGSAIVTVVATEPINGDSQIISNKGMMAIFSDGEWWCLPLSSSPADSGAGWTRPSDWITTPDLILGEEVVYGIARIYEDRSNKFELIASGDYTVDWGDGVSENYSAGAIASHTYSWSTVSSETLTTKGFRQALMELRPQPTFSLTDFDAAGNNYGRNFCSFAELKITSPNLANLDQIACASFTDVISVIIQHPNQIGQVLFSDCNFMSNIESIYADLPQAQNLEWAASYATKLKSIVLNTSPNLTTVRGMFDSTDMSESIFLISDTSGVTNFDYTFANSLITNEVIPVMDTSSATNMRGMFAWSCGIKSIPSWLDTSNVTNMENMFSGTPLLEHIPAIDMSNVSNANYFASSSSRLKSSDAFGATASHSYRGCDLNGNALNNIFNNLGTVDPPTAITGTTDLGTYIVINLATPLDIGNSFYNYMVFSGFTPSAYNGSSYVYYNYNNDTTKLYTYKDYFSHGAPFPPTVYGYVSLGGSIEITGNPGLSDISYDPSIATLKGWSVLE